MRWYPATAYQMVYAEYGASGLGDVTVVALSDDDGTTSGVERLASPPWTRSVTPS